MEVKMSPKAQPIKLDGNLSKYAEPLSKAEDFQLQQIAEECRKNFAGWNGLTNHETRQLMLWCEQEIARQNAKGILG